MKRVTVTERPGEAYGNENTLSSHFSILILTYFTCDENAELIFPTRGGPAVGLVGKVEIQQVMTQLMTHEPELFSSVRQLGFIP